MKKRFFILSAVFSSCIFSMTCGLVANELNPNMPTGGKQRCYPASMCTGDPNLIGGSGPSQGQPNLSGNGNTFTSKILQTESTEKFKGVVKSMNRVALPDQTQIQMVLTTDQGDMLVIVGPANFIDQQKIKLQPGDKIVVTGYRIKANGNDIIIAAEIAKNGNSLQLLDDKRQPAWGGQNAPTSTQTPTGMQKQPGMQTQSNMPNQWGAQTQPGTQTQANMLNQWGSQYQPGMQYRSGTQYQSGMQYQPGMQYQSGMQYQPGTQYQSGMQYQPGTQYQSGMQYQPGMQYQQTSPSNSWSQY